MGVQVQHLRLPPTVVSRIARSTQTWRAQCGALSAVIDVSPRGCQTMHIYAALVRLEIPVHQDIEAEIAVCSEREPQSSPLFEKLCLQSLRRTATPNRRVSANCPEMNPEHFRFRGSFFINVHLHPAVPKMLPCDLPLPRLVFHRNVTRRNCVKKMKLAGSKSSGGILPAGTA